MDIVLRAIIMHAAYVAALAAAGFTADSLPVVVVPRVLRRILDPRAAPPDLHRLPSAYLNELDRLGCQLRKIAEPALAPQL